MMNINVVDMNKMALNIEIINTRLEHLIKQLEKNKVKYPIGLTYDQLYKEISASAENEDSKKYRIVRIK